MKAKLFFPENLIVGYSKDDRPEQIKVNESIKNKVHDKIIDLPCLPTKEMQVNISSFKNIYGFSKKENEWIEDCNQYHYVTDIFIHNDCVEVWLDNNKDYNY